jgi:hypothetical protein
VHQDVRLLAVLCIQHTVKRHWRCDTRCSAGMRTVTVEEKDRLRAFLLSQMEEDSNVVGGPHSTHSQPLKGCMTIVACPLSNMTDKDQMIIS